MARLSLIFFTLLTLGFSARAEEGEGEAPAKSGKSDKGATVLPTPEWIEVQAKLQATKAKVVSKEKAVNDLIQEKITEKDPHKLYQIVDDLKKEHKELQTLTAEYEQLRNLYRYRFPEKGQKEETKYKRMEVKPLDEMESQAGLEGRLQHTLHKVRKQYGEPDPSPVGSTSKTTVVPKKEESSITEPAVLSK